MKRKTLLTLIAMGSYALLNASQVIAQEGADVAAGKYAFATCSGCHAIPGYTNTYPTYRVPRLGGQDPDYIVDALKAYKAQDRGHETMHANAADLSEQDMANIAAFLNSFELGDEIGPVSGDYDLGKEKAEAACETCHGANVENPPSPSKPPLLSGQFQDYLVKALKDYKSGARNNAIMAGMVAGLSDEDIVNIAAYYAQQVPALAVIDYAGKE